MSSATGASAGSPRASDDLAGIGMMLLAVLMFSINDVLGKWLVATYSVGQILLIRGAAAFLILAPFIIRAGRRAFSGAPNPPLQVLRAGLSTLEVACFYWAVTDLPLVNVMTYYLAAPIYVTALSALLLGERVGIVRWSAVLIGFLGVLIALQPSATSWTWSSAVAVAGSVFFAFLMITTRYLRGTSDTVLITAQVTGSLTFGAVAAPLTWVAVAPVDLALIALLGVVSLAALLLVNRALTVAPASVVVPYQYTLIVWAVLFGYWFFGDVPNAATIAGAAIIIASGLFIFLREQQIARQKAAAAAT